MVLLVAKYSKRTMILAKKASKAVRLDLMAQQSYLGNETHKKTPSQRIIKKVVKSRDTFRLKYKRSIL